MSSYALDLLCGKPEPVERKPIQLNEFPPDWVVSYVVCGCNMAIVWYGFIRVATWWLS